MLLGVCVNIEYMLSQCMSPTLSSESVEVRLLRLAAYSDLPRRPGFHCLVSKSKSVQLWTFGSSTYLAVLSEISFVFNFF